jgi:hypothetical protein
MRRQIPRAAATPGLASPAADLPDLRVVPSAALRLHEDSDLERVERLTRRLTADGVLRNPPIAAALDDPGGEFVVLDGANRVTAMQRSGLPHQVVQIVAYDDPSVVVDVWAHLLQRDGALVRALPLWMPAGEDDVRRGLEGGAFACGLVTARGAWGARIDGTLEDRVRALAAIVGAYKGKVPIYRVAAADFEALADEYGGADALVLFPRFSKSEIRAVARLPVKLPSGISRHIVPLRALRLNVDLALLAGDEPVEAKQARLDAMIRARLLERRVRLYPEATVLYDE